MYVLFEAGSFTVLLVTSTTCELDGLIFTHTKRNCRLGK